MEKDKNVLEVVLEMVYYCVEDSKMALGLLADEKGIDDQMRAEVEHAEVATHQLAIRLLKMVRKARECQY